MKKKLLIVEDDKEQSEWLYLIFSEHYDIFLAQTGVKAQEFFQKHHDTIAALILDIRLPDMTAFELLNSLEEKMHFDRIPPTVIQSGYEADEWIQRMLGEHRALKYLVKPFQENDIVEAVNFVIEADQAVYKGGQVQERMSLMISLHKIRQYLYHQITQLPKPEQETWLNRIVDLFNLYGIKTDKGYPSGNENDFKLKTSLKPILKLIESLSDFQIEKYAPRTLTIHGEETDFLNELIPKSHFKQYDAEDAEVLIVYITEKNLAESLDYLKKWHSHDVLGCTKYSIAVADSSKKGYLEQAVINGATQTLFRNQTFPHLFPQMLQKLGERLYELQIISNFVEYIT